MEAAAPAVADSPLDELLLPLSLLEEDDSLVLLSLSLEDLDESLPFLPEPLSTGGLGRP